MATLAGVIKGMDSDAKVPLGVKRTPNIHLIWIKADKGKTLASYGLLSASVLIAICSDNPRYKSALAIWGWMELIDKEEVNKEVNRRLKGELSNIAVSPNGDIVEVAADEHDLAAV